MSTRFGSFSSVTHDVRAVIEYWIDWPKYWRTVLVLLHTRATSAAVPRWALNTEPLPTWFQGTMDGSGTQGVCEEVVAIWAITGWWPGVSSSRWNSA